MHRDHAERVRYLCGRIGHEDDRQNVLVDVSVQALWPREGRPLRRLPSSGETSRHLCRGSGHSAPQRLSSQKRGITPHPARRASRWPAADHIYEQPLPLALYSPNQLCDFAVLVGLITQHRNHLAHCRERLLVPSSWILHPAAAPSAGRYNPSDYVLPERQNPNGASSHGTASPANRLDSVCDRVCAPHGWRTRGQRLARRGSANSIRLASL
jgi:hypothetical protein